MKILIAEDEEDIAYSYKSALESRNHEVTVTSNGKQCLLEYRSRFDGSRPPFDIVILDYRMPEMDGFETAKAILGLVPDQRIVFASAYTRQTLTEMIQKDGMIVELLQKPFGRKELFDTIEDTYIYSQLQKLRVDIGDLKKWNLHHNQLSDLLDALLRLKDPKAFFESFVDSATVDHNEAQISKSQQKQVGSDETDNAIATIIDEAIRFLGPDSVSVFYYHLARMGIEKQTIARNPTQFLEALDKIFSGASDIVQMRILKAIEEHNLIDETGAITNFVNSIRKAKISTYKGREV